MENRAPFSPVLDSLLPVFHIRQVSADEIYPTLSSPTRLPIFPPWSASQQLLCYSVVWHPAYMTEPLELFLSHAAGVQWAPLISPPRCQCYVSCPVWSVPGCHEDIISTEKSSNDGYHDG